MSSTASRIRPEEADELIALYCDWREECALVQASYDRFAASNASDRVLAFAAFAAALEREESAARAYADHISVITSRHR